jgi:hypothetical protein
VAGVVALVAALLSGVVCASQAVAASGPGPAGFGAPIVLKAPVTGSMASPVLSASSSGAVVVGWSASPAAGGSSGVVVRRGTTSGHFGAPQTVTGSGSEPAVAAGRGGGAAVAWESIARRGATSHLEASVAIGRGRFGKPQLLASTRAGVGPVWVLASDGRYVAVWLVGVPASAAHAVRYAVANAAGHFGAARTLAANAALDGGFSAAAGPDGTVTAAWRTRPSPIEADNEQLRFAELAPASTTFGAVEAVPADPQANASDGAEVSSGPGGTALSWTDVGASSQTLRTALIGPGGPPAPASIFTLASTDFSKLFEVGPSVALPGDGLPPVAAFAVARSPGVVSSTVTAGDVFAVSAALGGTYETAVELSAPGTIATQAVAGASRSTAVVAWTTGALHDYRLAYAVRSGSGAFGAARSLGRTRSAGPIVLASSTGAVVAAWVAGGAPNHLGIDVAILRDRS